MSLTLPQPGQIILDSFRLEQQLGAGAFAVAFLATQLGTDRRAVVKLPHPHLLEGHHGPEIRRRFDVEARAASRVAHPNVVTIYMVGQTPQGIPAIAMEFVDGEPLASHLRAMAPLSVTEIGALGEQLGQALVALHKVGIVHRDLSPANVMVSGQGRAINAKLLDFGVAKLLDAPTMTLGPMGTPGYLAPEQLQGQVTPRTDVYSLGAILWWALTGQERPDDFSDGSLLKRMGSTQGPDLFAVRPDTPASLATIVSRMLIPAHEHRLSVEEFLREWRAALAADIPTRLTPSELRDTVPSTPQRVAVVVGNSVLHALTSSYLHTGGLEIVSCEARALTRSNPGTYAAAVIDAELPGVDVRELLQVLAECHEDLALIVIGTAEQAGTLWSVFGANAFVQLPEEIDRLRKEVSVALGRALTTIGSGRLSAPIIDRLRARGQLDSSLNNFIGGVPQWIAEIQVALADGDLDRASVSCDQLLTSADSLGLRDLARLARAAGAFIHDGDLESAGAFAAAVEREYLVLFPEVFNLMNTHGPLVTMS